jgi:hypothetical protein
MNTRPLEIRFWEKVARGSPDECWEWQGSRYRNGYGAIGIGGRAGGPRGAHRVCWELTHGPIPAGLYVLHRCDNPPCVNPAHLFLGTQTTNMRDCSRKGRARGGTRGEQSGNAKLTEAAIREIRERYRSGQTQVALAKAFGVGQTTVSGIVTRRAWAHV